ncbi:G-protein-signaling modulator 1-like [Dunckerocampus dactyliophorus]|uniref:G-protein-signaling modulator 1-like n=1 Tax=Dunckerocampus dactyliophorus TaxID=161453 RepID=UPI0024059846|nr:G-protein-signaling modulator 1-like [Dunckerocampus dactyliophorus]XP_054638957.1 G-protein-signaling modulator 1-like [Dunckerocampus dactyliophorus]
MACTGLQADVALDGSQGDVKEGVATERLNCGSAPKTAEEENKEEPAVKAASEELQTNTEEVCVDVNDTLEDAEDGPMRGEDESVTPEDLLLDFKTLTWPELHVEGSPSHGEEGAKKARRLTPDFPEALYELLCTLQEGRRLNDQRCSFRLESGMRRRCHSEPNATKPANRVIFSSMTSLQREEFFELVATAQARRLDDQRAQLQKSARAKQKARSFRGSIKHLSFVRRPEKPAPVPKEELYDMILTTQAQGRLEDQRSRAPGPMDDEDFFSLLLKVQGGRMDEQRTELPCMLQT